jgi:hypothetical protein
MPNCDLAISRASSAATATTTGANVGAGDGSKAVAIAESTVATDEREAGPPRAASAWVAGV